MGKLKVEYEWELKIHEPVSQVGTDFAPTMKITLWKPRNRANTMSAVSGDLQGTECFIVKWIETN